MCHRYPALYWDISRWPSGIATQTAQAKAGQVKASGQGASLGQWLPPACSRIPLPGDEGLPSSMGQPRARPQCGDHAAWPEGWPDLGPGEGLALNRVFLQARRQQNLCCTQQQRHFIYPPFILHPKSLSELAVSIHTETFFNRCCYFID